MTLAWSGFPLAYVFPQSPRTANENGLAEPTGSCVTNWGAGSLPSRSICEVPK
jgi:hypothetical protein